MTTDKEKYRPLPGDSYSDEEKEELMKIDCLQNTSKLGELKNKKLKEFSDLRHRNEISWIREENLRMFLENKKLGQNKNKLYDPWDATKYKDVKSYDIVTAYIRLLSESEFFATMIRHVRFQPTLREDLKTAGVRFDIRRDEFVLEYNPKFMKWMHDERGIDEVVFVLVHEMLHIVLGHVTSRIRSPHGAWNVATDAVIDAMCTQMRKKVPSWVILPGRYSVDMFGDDLLTRYGVKRTDVANTIASWKIEDDVTSEKYFNELMKKHSEKFEEKVVSVCIGRKGNEDGKLSDFEGFDSHDWNVTIDSDDEGNDRANGQGAGNGQSFDFSDFEEYISEKARDLVEKAVQNADTKSNGWGNMPADYQNSIRKMVSRKVDWRTLLKQFYGRTLRGDRKCTIRRINRKYPMIHPGTSRSYVAKLFVAIDESGSVGNEAVEMFFGELAELTKKTSVDWAPFDTRCEEKNLKTWKKGRPSPDKRDYCGGTCFQAPTDYANDPKNRGRWDGFVILTDGQAPKPGPSRIRRAWILAPGCKLEFDVPGETVIHMDDDGKVPFGSWR